MEKTCCAHPFTPAVQKLLQLLISICSQMLGTNWSHHHAAWPVQSHFLCSASGVLQHKSVTVALLYCGACQGEKSERLLQLTADMINSNSADYTAWQHRWDTLTALQANLQNECVFTE